MIAANDGLYGSHYHRWLLAWLMGALGYSKP